ncbi:hypothetical protein Q3G72_035369 [Acer saccharum]|nr:hypothetical protein Q3G72_035369 [Acer saccharum]
MHTMNLSLESTTTRIKNNESFCVNCWKECEQCGNPFWVIMTPAAAEPRMLDISVDDDDEERGQRVDDERGEAAKRVALRVGREHEKTETGCRLAAWCLVELRDVWSSEKQSEGRET